MTSVTQQGVALVSLVLDLCTLRRAVVCRPRALTYGPVLASRRRRPPPWTRYLLVVRLSFRFAVFIPTDMFAALRP